MKIEKFEDMEIWQEARELNKTIFLITSKDPFAKDFDFRSQIRRAAGSIMDNIAEGFGRAGNKEFVNFLSISRGSADEVRSQVYRAFDFGYINQDQLDELLDRTSGIARRIKGFMDYLKKSSYKGHKFK